LTIAEYWSRRSTDNVVQFNHCLIATQKPQQATVRNVSTNGGIGYDTLAEICCVSKSSTYHWLAGQTSRRVAGRPYQRILAVADFLLTNAERIQPMLERWREQG